MIDEITAYIISFLIGNRNEKYSSWISYGESDTAKIIIKKSSFFDNYDVDNVVMPQLPLPQWNNIPILYGSGVTSINNGQVIIEADIIASTFFLVSRLEEVIKREKRDKNGRFPVKESLAYRAGFIDRPIVDEYGIEIKKILKSVGAEVDFENGFSKIYLTHDVDHIYSWKSIISATKSFVKRIVFNLPEKLWPFIALWDIRKDPEFTFPLLYDLDKMLAENFYGDKVEMIYFLMGAKKGKFDDDYINSQRFNAVYDFLDKKNVIFGLHNSYQASLDKTKTAVEKNRIENRLGKKIYYQRSHMLEAREPEDLYVLIDAGITDDFTMGFAEQLGFRLGTSKAIYWIDPVKLAVTKLKLHNLTCMDITLSEERYMNIKEKEVAIRYVMECIQKIYEVGGEVDLLWHNSTIASYKKNYHREVYSAILKRISEDYI